MSSLSSGIWYLVASLPSLCLALVVWRRKRGRGAVWFACVCAAAGVLGVLTAGERLAPTLEGKLLWARLAYLPLVVLAPAWLLFAVEYTDSLPWLRDWKRTLLFAPGLVTLALALTEPSHGLIWRSVALSAEAGLPSLAVERGVWFWLGHAGWSWTLIVGAVLILLGHLLRVTPFHRPQVAILAVSPILPLVGNVLYVSGVRVIGPFDPTPLALGVAALLVFWGHSVNGLLDLRPLAFETVIQAIDETVLVVDDRNRILALNPAAARRLGKPAAAVLGRDAAEVYSRWPDAVERWRSVKSTREQMSFGSRHGAQDVEVRIIPLENGDGTCSGRVFIGRDLRLQRAYDNMLEQAASNDPLSGLPNRRAFQHFAEKALAYAQRRGLSIAVLFVDLDSFEQVNDRWGHSTGNELLAAVGHRLGEVMRKENIAARLGGDEFVVLLQGADQDAARAAARNLKRQLEPPYRIAGVDLEVEASLGVALFPRDARTVRDLLACADVAMLEAKRTQTGLAFYDERLQERNDGARRICFTEEIEQALERGEVLPYYQPIVDTAGRSPVAVEALARWCHPERGLMLPATFLPVAESRRIVRRIDRRILETAAREIGPTGLDLSVNVSIGRLLEEGFVRDLERVLAENDLEPSRLILEITETELANPEQAGPVMRTIRGTGVRIATDDFGSGYSSLGYLRRLPLDLLKIEHTLIDGIGERGGDEAIVSAILAVARNLGLSIVAEGVERESQREWLEKNRCPLIQGYLIERPLSRDELVEWLAAARTSAGVVRA